MDGVNFLPQADYTGPATLGTIYGKLDSAAFTSGESYLFTVDTFSLAPAGYGALLITYSDLEDEDDFGIVSADWIEEFTLTLPPTDLTDLFTFDFAPAAFGKLGPQNGAIGQGTKVDLSWNSSGGATGYEYCIDEIAGTECDTGWVSTGTADSITLSSLPYNAVYYWQVRAVNNYETTDADGGTWWSFATITGAPARFSKSTPTDEATAVATSPLLDWDDADGAEYYEFCVESFFGECNVELNWLKTDLVSQAVVSLDDSTTYSWQVRAVNSAGTTYADDEAWWTFTTVTSFEKVSPEDGTEEVNPKETLEWGDLLGATSYQYCVNTTDKCNRWINAGAETTVAVKGLKYNTKYYWQVRAVTDTGTTEADGGTWWTFTTRDKKARPKTPIEFSKVSPEDEAIDQPVTNLTLEWEPQIKATSYAYCIDDSGDDMCINWVKTDLTSVVIPILDYSTTYYWQVRATVEGVVGYADEGYWKFTTMVDPVIGE
jgi:hypothetical protein